MTATGRLTLAFVAAVAVLAGTLGGAFASANPSPPTPRVAKLQRQVAKLQRQVANVQALALSTAQSLQASHDAYDALEARVSALERRNP